MLERRVCRRLQKKRCRMGGAGVAGVVGGEGEGTRVGGRGTSGKKEGVVCVGEEDVSYPVLS